MNTLLSLDDIIKALNELAPLKICWREDGSFYCGHESVEIGDGGTLTSPTQHASTAKGAVLQYWDELTNLVKGNFIVVNAHDKKRRRELFWDKTRWSEYGKTGSVMVRSVKDLPLG